LIFSLLQLFPTGDGQGRMIAENQPVTLAAMEALFASQPGAPLVILGQPNVDGGRSTIRHRGSQRAELSDLPRVEGAK
jgi:cytochrome bd-type quinol oxidase subunit 1